MKRLVCVACMLAFFVASTGATETKTTPGKKNPALSTLLAIFLPGAGQAYNGQWKKCGFVVFTVGFGTMCMSTSMRGDNLFDGIHEGMEDIMVLGMVMTYGGWLYGILDAPTSSVAINKRLEQAHMIGNEGDRFSWGIDPITSRRKWGAVLSLRF